MHIHKKHYMFLEALNVYPVGLRKLTLRANKRD